MALQQNPQIPNFEKGPQGPGDTGSVRSGWEDVSGFQPGPEQLQALGMADLLPAETEQVAEIEPGEMSAADIESIKKQLLEKYNEKSFESVLNTLLEWAQAGVLKVSEDVVSGSRNGDIDAINILIDAINIRTAEVADSSGLTEYEHSLIINKLQIKIKEVKEKDEKKKEEENPTTEEEAVADNDSDSDGGYDGGFDSAVVASDTTNEEPKKETIQDETTEELQDKKKDLNKKQQLIEIIMEAASDEIMFNQKIYDLAGKLPIDGASSLLSEPFKHFNIGQRVEIMTATEEALALTNEGPDNGRIYGEGIIKWFDKKLNVVRGDKENGTKQSLKEFLGLQGYNDSLSGEASGGNKNIMGNKAPNLRVIHGVGDLVGGITIDNPGDIAALAEAGITPEAVQDAAASATPGFTPRIVSRPNYTPNRPNVQSSQRDQIDHLKRAA